MKLIPEKMIPDYGQNVYDKVSEITGLKFKSQMKGSGIVFKQVFEMNDLVTNEKTYLILTNSDSIWFSDRDDFIQRFIFWIKKSIDQLNAEYQEVQERQNQAVVDEKLMFLEHERIGYTGEKQLKLLNKMREYRTEFPDVNEKQNTEANN